MLKWTVQQKRHRAATDSQHESDAGSSSSSTSSSESPSNSFDDQQSFSSPDNALGQVKGGNDAVVEDVVGCTRSQESRGRRGSASAAAAAAAADEGGSTASAGHPADERQEAERDKPWSFLRQPSIRQPKTRQARPLSLNLELHLLSRDKAAAAIPQKAKALLGIEERPRTPIGEVPLLDGVTVSPKAMAVLGLTPAQCTGARPQRGPQLPTKRSPATGRLQQISESSPSRCEADWASSSSYENGKAMLPTDVQCCSEGKDFRCCVDVSANDEDRCLEQRCIRGRGTTAVSAGPIKTERLNRAVEMVTTRPKVARRRPLKHSEKEALIKSISAIAMPAGTGSDPCSGGGLRRSGARTPDSGISIPHGCAAEHESLSDDDDAVIAWQQPVQGGCDRHGNFLGPSWQALCSPQSSHCDFIDIDVVLTKGKVSHGITCRGPDRFVASRELGTRDDTDLSRRLPPRARPVQNSHAVTEQRGGRRVCADTPQSSHGLRHAHSDPTDRTAAAGEQPYAVELEVHRWAATRAGPAAHAGGRSRYTELSPTSGHSSEMAAFRKTMHVYC